MMMNRRELTAARRALIDAYTENRDKTPETTVSALVDFVGYDVAVETVAAMVNAKGDWDARISRRCREWAAQHCDMTRDDLAAAYIFYCDDIHPAHMDQICTALMNYQPATEETPAPAPKTYTKGTAAEATEGTTPETTSAAVAMSWHREGHPVTVWGTRPDGLPYFLTIPGEYKPAPATRDDENQQTCRRIALELEAYTDGNVRRCPECGEIINRTDWDDVGDKFRCPHCEAVSDVDDLDQLNVYDFLEDVYDTEYRIDAYKDLRSVRVMVACGGPNIYIDTADAAVKLYWWNERAEFPISYDARDAVNDWASEMWGCM